MYMEMEMVRRYMNLNGFRVNFNHAKWSYSISGESISSKVFSGELAAEYIRLEERRKNREKYLNSYCLAA